jgi:hypothetical protein
VEWREKKKSIFFLSIKYKKMGDLPVSEGFIIAMFGGFSALLGGILACALKSRCSRIKCLCVECDRDVIPANQLDKAKVNTATPKPAI